MIVGIEWLAACQGIEFHAPVPTSPALRTAMDFTLRAHVAPYTEDRFFAPDMAAAARLDRAGSAVGAGTGPGLA